MSSQILMPALSPTMTEGKISKWLKKEGDAVRPGDLLAEIETDKAAMEVEASEEGIIAQILIAEGTEHVAVNTPIAVLAEEGEDVARVDATEAKPAEAAEATEATDAEARCPRRRTSVCCRTCGTDRVAAI